MNYSGSGGDTNQGHGSHVSGTVAGHSLGGGNNYRGERTSIMKGTMRG